MLIYQYLCNYSAFIEECSITLYSWQEQNMRDVTVRNKKNKF